MDTAHQKGGRGIDRCNSASPTKLGSLSATHTHTAKAGRLNVAKLGEESFLKRGAAPGNVPSIRPAWHGKTRASTRGPPRQIPGGRQARSGGKAGEGIGSSSGQCAERPLLYAVKARRQPVSGRRHPPHTINPCAPDWGRRNGSYRARPIGEAEKSVAAKRRHITRRYTRRAHGLAPPVSCRIFLAVLQSVLV